jgi:hypothetical protein
VSTAALTWQLHEPDIFPCSFVLDVVGKHNRRIVAQLVEERAALRPAAVPSYTVFHPRVRK